MKNNIKKCIASISFVIVLSLALMLIFISPLTAVGDGAANQHNTLTNVARMGNKLNVEPVTVFEVKNQDSLTALASAGVKPAVVILDVVDADINVGLQSSNQSFTTVFDTHIKNKAIPALRIETVEIATGFIQYYKTQYSIKDMMVVSSSIEVLKTIYADSATYIVNGVYDVSDNDLPSNRYDFFDTIGEANEAGTNIIMIDPTKPNASQISTYIAAMTKVCWGYTDGEVTSLVNSISIGTMGIVGNDITKLENAIKKFSKSGHVRSQFIAAHRGITKYANENSLTSVAASINEGATHIEVDLQVTQEGRIVLCHNSDATTTSNAPNNVWFAVSSLGGLKNYKLDDYSADYNETFPTLEEVIDIVKDSDVIMILELKLDNCSKLAHTTLGAIEQINSIMNRVPAMKGKWFTITFFEPYVLKMREIAPKIPVGLLGFALADWDSGDETGSRLDWQYKPSSVSLNNVGEFIDVMRRYNLFADLADSTQTHTQLQNYLARGYHLSTWTYQSTVHFETGINIATSDAMEQAALYVKSITVPQSITAAQLAEGKVTASCTTYNGWVYEYECEIIEIESGKIVLFYYQQMPVGGYGLYSDMASVSVA